MSHKICVVVDFLQVRCAKVFRKSFILQGCVHKQSNNVKEFYPVENQSGNKNSLPVQNKAVAFVIKANRKHMIMLLMIQVIMV